MVRRWRGVGQRRGHFLDVPPPAPVAAAPSWIPELAQPRRPVAALTRRGAFAEPPWPASTAPPTFREQAARRAVTTRRGQHFEPAWPASTWPPAFRDQTPRRGVLSRRGEFFGVPPAPVVVAAPGAVPGPLRARSRWLVRPPRGQFFEPSWQPVIYGTGLALGVGQGGRPGRRLVGFIARGTYSEPPWGQVAAQPSVWRPGFVRATLRLAGRPTRRGQHFEPAWPQGPQTVWRPDPIRATRRLAGFPARRGQFFEPPWPAVAAQPDVWRPGFTRASLRLEGRPTRRGNYHEPPWPQGPQTVWRPERTRQTPRLAGRPFRRGRFHQPPWPQGPQVAPWLPAFLRHRPRPVPAFIRRGQFHEPCWVEGPQTVWRPDPVCPAGGRPRWPTHRIRRARFHQPPWPPPPPPSYATSDAWVAHQVAGDVAIGGPVGAAEVATGAVGLVTPGGTVGAAEIDHAVDGEGTVT